MAVTLTYDTVLSRVRVAAGSLGASATYAVVDRSLDGVSWTTVRGGTAAAVASQSLTIPVDDYEFPADQLTTYRVRSYSAGGVLQQTQTATTTPVLDEAWLKFVAAPFLNRPVKLMGWGDIGRKSRNGIFQVAARREAVVVTDLHSTRSVTISLRAVDVADTNELDLFLSLGVPVFLHLPPGRPLPSLYAAVGDYSWDRPAARSVVGRFTVPLTEVAAPPASIVGSSSTWQTLLTNFATWQDVRDGNTNWLALLELIGSGTDIVVGT